MTNLLMRLLPLLAACAFVGCQSYTIVQSNSFTNDDGMIVHVDYGQSESDHVNTFVSPANGRELEFRSKLVVEVAMPEWPRGAQYAGNDPPYDGERFTAWQAMNFAGNGTLYKSDDEEWCFLASGFTCRIARRDERAEAGYRDVFSGVLFNTPVKRPEKDDRWRTIKPRASGARVP